MSDDSIPNRFLGYLMMAVGGMIALLCGGCTLYAMTGAALTGNTNLSQIMAMLSDLWPFFAVFGGAPTLFGVVLFVSGLRRAGLIDKKGQKPPYKV